MKMLYRNRHNRQEYTDNRQKIILGFLVGFFVGAVLYYLFQKSFITLKSQLENNVLQWENKEPFRDIFLRTLWFHGKYYILFWVMAVGRWKRVYQNLFIAYTGFRNGFFMMFLFFTYGIKGFAIVFVSNFPQCMLFVPLYWYSMFLINQKRQSKHRISTVVVLILVFTAACFIEVKANLPIMAMLL